MDEQRLERALRAGPPFATAYVARPLRLEKEVIMSRPLTLRRTAIMLALLGLLLAATVVGALAAGLFRAPLAAVVVRPAGECAVATDHHPLCADTISAVFADGHEETIFPPAGSDPVALGLPRLSPDGAQLIFLAASVADNVGVDGPSASWGLWTLRADGTDLRQLADRYCGAVRWSPDGRTIACASQSFEDGTDRTTLFAIDVASGASTQLAVADGLGWPPDFPYRWSPNGEWLGYLTPEGLWVVRRDGSDRRQLASGPAIGDESRSQKNDLLDFRWSPTSDAIAYGTMTSPHEAINVVRLDGTEVTITLPDQKGVGAAHMLAWDHPDRLTYRSNDWRFVATTALDGTRTEVVFDFRGKDRPWVYVSADPWLAADGHSLAWWEIGESRTCLVAVENGSDSKPQFCFVNQNERIGELSEGSTARQFAVGQE